MHHFIQKQWQKKGAWAWLMSPLALLVCSAARLKRFAYKQGWLECSGVNVPVIVVGNITVGGVGKSPLVAYIAKMLRDNGYQPGVICRGYKGQSDSWPQVVTPESDPVQVGDESVMLAQQTACPVVAGPKRVQSAQQLLDEFNCDVIISDDGFQHLQFARDIDVLVIDGARGLGNKWCLPAGPLREGVRALNAADMLVTHCQQLNDSGEGGRYEMALKAGKVYALGDGRRKSGDALKQQPLHAIAGIGHPKRFFKTLSKHGFTIIEHAFSDHHAYAEKELAFMDTHDIITTEKDAIKLAALKLKQTVWVLPVQAVMSQNFNTDLLARLKQVLHA